MEKKNAHKGANPPSGFRKYAGLLFRSQTGTIGFFILLMILIIAIFAPHIAPYDPTSVDLRGMRMPPFWMEGGSMEHILGCDNLGRDLWSRIIYGTRVSLTAL